jgi:chaperonin cofactor prefoldin
MAISSIAPTFEDAVAIIKAATTAPDLLRRMPDIEAGLEDLVQRLQHLEAYRSQDMHDIQEMKVANANHAAVVNTLGSDRDDARKRLDTLEKTPPDVNKRLDAMEAEIKRLRAQIVAPLPGTRSAPIKASDPKASLVTDAQPNAESPKPTPFFSGPARPDPVIQP